MADSKSSVEDSPTASRAIAMKESTSEDKDKARSELRNKAYQKKATFVGVLGPLPPESDAEQQYQDAYNIIIEHTRQPCADRICSRCTDCKEWNPVVYQHCSHCWHCKHCSKFEEIQDICQSPYVEESLGDLIDVYLDYMPYFQPRIWSLETVKRNFGRLEYIDGWEDTLRRGKEAVAKLQDEPSLTSN
jgi:hypothetical protein